MLSARRDWLLLLGILVVVTIAALPVLVYPLGRDQGEFATIGRGILDGRVPYVDLWNPKPPAVFYVYAAAMTLFGRTAPALRAIDLLIAPVISVALYWLGARTANRRVGLWAALVFPVFYFTETFWTLTQNDGIVLLPMTLAVVCAVKAADGERRAWAWAFVCGALCAWTLWFKYPFALFLPVVLVAYVMPRGRRIDWRVVLAFVAGGLAVGLGGVAYLASIGALDALIESARVTAQYTALGLNAADFGDALQTYIGFRWSQWGLLVMLALAGLTLRWQGAGAYLPFPHQEGRGRGMGGKQDDPANSDDKDITGAPEAAAPRFAWGVVWVWLLAGLAIMLVQAKGYDYHWLPMLPPLVLIASSGIDRLLALPRRPVLTRVLSGLAALGLISILVVGVWGRTFPYITGRESQMDFAARFVAGEFVADESLAVTTYLRERVAPGDSLFIWGFRPELYYESGLNPATRFIFQFPLVAPWYPPAWKDEAVDTLWAALPPYALVLQVDYMPWVTGRDDDSNTLLQEYTELNNWLIHNYERETQIGNVFVWRRKP